VAAPSIAALLPDGKIIVVCGRTDDADAWRDLLGPGRCLTVALDDAPRETRFRGASDQLDWQHDTIAGLDGSGWLAQAADAFDPDNAAALVLPDPLDPPLAGTRKRLGQRAPTWRLFEDKTAVDALWDALGVTRARSIVTDDAADLARLGALVDRGGGVVCSYQPTGAGPAAGGDGIWWWRHNQSLPTVPVGGGRCRVRLMPFLEGTPVRLHGFVLARTIVVFPPMEIVTLLRRDRGTFLCAGTVPTLGYRTDLVSQTRRVGTGLRDRLDYRGGFSVDGIVTVDGFLPTDFNARLTSAMEAAPCDLRVRLHVANILAREGPGPDPAAVEYLADNVFARGGTYTLYGAATSASAGGCRAVAVRWTGQRLVVTYSDPADGRLALTRSARGWLLTATLDSSCVPLDGPVGGLAPTVFRLSDQVLGTDFGDLAPPPGADGASHPVWCGDAEQVQALAQDPCGEIA
jgi:hypothetical protein